MRSKSIFAILIVLTVTALALTGCGGGSTGGGTGILKLSMTDAPGIGNVTAVNLTISRVAISHSADDATESWITLTDTPQTFDVMTLTNASLQELGIKSLPAGQYNQIRFYVTSAQVVVDDVTYDITVPSGMFRTAGSFTLQDGVTTELVVDFNVAKSVVKQGNGQYRLQPVTRLTSLVTTGAISGKVLLNPTSADATITVSTTDPSNSEVQIGTTCAADGTFTLGYLSAGSYTLTVSADGYDSDTTLTGVTVTVGNTTTVSDVTLNQTAPAEPTP